MSAITPRRMLLALALLAGAGLASAIASAAEYEVPPQLQVSILLKVLVYDRSLASRSRGGLNLGVAFDPKSDASKSCKDSFLKAFNETPRILAGATINAVETPQESVEAAADHGVSIVYLCSGVKTDKLLEVAHKRQMITFAGDEAAVLGGAAIGLVPRDGKPKLLINVNASIASGMQLDPQILRLAELVRGK